MRYLPAPSQPALGSVGIKNSISAPNSIKAPTHVRQSIRWALPACARKALTMHKGRRGRSSLGSACSTCCFLMHRPLCCLLKEGHPSLTPKTLVPHSAHLSTSPVSFHFQTGKAPTLLVRPPTPSLQCPRPGWMGLWAPLAGGRCPCSWEQLGLDCPFQPKPSSVH